MKKLIITILCLMNCLLNPFFGQDLHFSQPFFQPIFLNPAQTGIFKGNLRVSGSHRSQWQSVPVNYQTFGLAADGKALRQGQWSLNGGLAVHRDRAGDAGLSWTQVGASGSVAHALGNSQAISIGFSAGFVQRTFDISKLRFKNQWNGEQFDPSRISKEVFQQASKMQPTLAAGINYHAQSSERRNQLNVGIAAAHINQPAVSFDNDLLAKLPIRWNIGGSVSLEISHHTDLVGFIQIGKMGGNAENLIGLGYKYWLSTLVGRQISVQMSAALRTSDALVPALQIEYNSWTLGLSYDLNVSGFDVATQRRGGFEVGAMYRIVPVPLPSVFKVCPIF